MTLFRFLAWAFYWMRLELVCLQHPNLACSVVRTRAKHWRVQFGETVGEGREAWRAVRHALEGTPDAEPVRFDEAELVDVANALAGAQDQLEPPTGTLASSSEATGAGETLGDSDVLTAAAADALELERRLTTETLDAIDDRLEAERAALEEPQPQPKGF